MERHPWGSFKRSTPCAGPFSLLCTVAVKANDFELSGTAPAEGETVTEMAGPTSRGLDRVPMPDTRSLVCTYSAMFERNAVIRKVRLRGQRIGREWESCGTGGR